MKINNKALILIVPLILFTGIFIAYFYWNKQNPTYNEFPVSQVEVKDSIITNPVYDDAVRFDTKSVLHPSFKLNSEIKELPIYEYTPITNTDRERIAGEIAKSLQLSNVLNRNDPVLGKVIMASEGQKEFSYYENTGEIYYNNSPGGIPDPLFLSSNNMDSYEALARDYIRGIGIDLSNYKLVSSKFLRNEGGHLVDSTRPEASEALELIFNANINDIPIVDKSWSLSPNTISVTLNKNGEVRRLSYYPIGQVGLSTDTQPLKSEKQLKNEIENNEAVFVSGTFSAFDKIKYSTILKANLAYYIVGNKTVPIYILESNVVTDQQEEGVGYMFIEAINRDTTKK